VTTVLPDEGHCTLGRLCMSAPATLQVSMPNTLASEWHIGTPFGSIHLRRASGQGA
jgi:hypothetical protein